MGRALDPVTAFIETREALLRAADAVPPEHRRTPFVGHWHLMHLLAHLVGWDYTNVEAIDALRRGRTPAFYAQYDPGWTAHNRQLVERYGTDDWPGLRYAIAQSQAAVVAVLRGLSPEALTQPHSDPERRRPVTIAGILRAAIHDEQEHLEQILAFSGQALSPSD